MSIKCRWIYVLITVLFACNKAPDPTIEGESGGGEVPVEGNVQIDINKKFQTIESFAASDCWFGEYIGKYWNESEKSSIAKLLFSKEMSGGKAEGIGLSGWRFNLGGGTMQQGDASGIEDISRRAESFIEPDGMLNWDRQAGQRYFLEQAKGYGCEQFVMFSNTPPVNYTRNGKGYSQMGANSNLKDEHYTDFANYMTTVLDHFKTSGINFQYISPVNEPQYNWDAPSQEGSGWQNSEIARLTRALNTSLSNKGLDTKIMLAEAGAWNYVYETDGDAGRKNVINNLFSSSSSNYVGGLDHVAPIIAGHSYWTDGSWQSLLSSRTTLNAAAQGAGLKVYQTEWSMLGGNYDASEFVGFEQASYMDIALYMSKVIHMDLVNANAASWSYWTALATERWSHKNRFLLIKVTPAGGDYADIRQSGRHAATKTLWALGNYSLFIRPNYVRVDLQLSGNSKLLFGSAYRSPDGKKIVAVYTNLGTAAFDAKAIVSNQEVNSLNAYVTSETEDLVERKIQDANSSVMVNPKSIVTVVYNLK